MNAMSDEQLDQALGQAMQRQSLQDIPATRTPPAPPWATEAGRTVTYVPAKSRRWLHAGIGVAAAAAVVTAVVLATGHNGSPAPGGTPTGSTVPTTPSSPTTDATGPTETPATTDAPQSGTATLGGATVALPTGWSAVHRPNIVAGADTWCLGEGGNCRVTFHRYDVVGYGGPEPEVPTGTTVATSKYCGTDAPVGPVLIDSRTSTVGGREAEYRKWTLDCPTGTLTIAQYVLPSAPAYEIFVKSDYAPVVTDLETIAKATTFPAATGGLRYYDQGHVESATAVGDGYDIVLRRYTGSDVNDWVATDVRTTYHLTTTLLPPGYVIGNLGREVLQLYTDGTAVTSVVIPGG